MTSSKSIAIIIGSTRSPRVGSHVVDFIKKTVNSQANVQGVTVTTVDLKDFNLPVYDEPVVPAMVSDAENYAHEHSRRWAREIARHDGYVLVSPEYNYGMPGSVKNAIDFLYHPWKGKPIAIITYGLNGGKTSSEQLENTFSRMGLHVSPTRPQLAFFGGPTGADTGAAMTTGELGKSSLEDWEKKSASDIVKAFEEVREVAVSVSAEAAAAYE